MKVKNCLHKIVLGLFCVLSPVFANGQISIGEFVQESTFHTEEGRALYFIDFWATWCIPCVAAQEYLGVLQKQNPADFYIVSMSNENSDKVIRYLKKHPTDLAVALDYNNENFTAYNVSSLPYGVLLNSEGDLLWEGNPANFKQTDLNRFLRKATKKESIADFFNIVKTELAPSPVVYTPKNPIEFILLDGDATAFEVVDHGDYMNVAGSLQNILAYYLKVYKTQIILPESLNRFYQGYVSKAIVQASNFKANLLQELGIVITADVSEGEALVLDFSHSNLWDTQQIDWGVDSAHYLIDDSEIQADNVSIVDMMYQLSIVLEMPVVSVDAVSDQALYDWVVHYRFYDLMQSSMLDNYGIYLEQVKTDYSIYHISKKAP